MVVVVGYFVDDVIFVYDFEFVVFDVSVLVYLFGDKWCGGVFYIFWCVYVCRWCVYVCGCVV